MTSSSTWTIFDRRVVGPLACNCYTVGDPASRHAIVIDPGDDAEAIAAASAARGLSVTAIVATHAHFDHIVAAQRLRDITGAPFYLHPHDRFLLGWMQASGRLFLGVELPPPPEIDLGAEEGDRLTAGSLELEVLHTPGHSPGSISLVAPGAVFSGDTLFAGSVGRTDLPGGDQGVLISSITTKLFSLPDGMEVYPGHGPPTSLEVEQRDNPWVGGS
ncbi:MAG: MBL fold metallo-hydrolase [Actinobacteria bacterium]|nr:MBL fold metallo-hydrolase [Actinomycetota bacterium]